MNRLTEVRKKQAGLYHPSPESDLPDSVCITKSDKQRCQQHDWFAVKTEHMQYSMSRVPELLVCTQQYASCKGKL